MVVAPWGEVVLGVASLCSSSPPFVALPLGLSFNNIPPHLLDEGRADLDTIAGEEGNNFLGAGLHPEPGQGIFDGSGLARSLSSHRNTFL